MIEASHPDLSIVQQYALLQISRSGHYYRPIGQSKARLALMRLIDEAFLDCPDDGSRQMTRHLHRLGHQVGRNRVVRLMRKMGATGYIPEAQHQRASSRAPGVFLPAAGSGDCAAEPGLVLRYHVYSDAAGFFVSGGDHGLA